MRTLQFRSLSLAALTVLVLATNTLAQTPAAPAPLSAAEFQQLVSSGTPADHARLKAYFSALADQDIAEAKRHDAMQQAFARNTKMGAMATSMSAHCKRLADISKASAASTRELAAEHDTLAAGATFTPPVSRPMTAGVETTSDTEWSALAAKATTAADHQRLEQYFTAQATRYDRDAANHTAYAKSWRASTKAPNAASIAAHCDQIAAQKNDAAKEARSAANMHKQHAAQMK